MDKEKIIQKQPSGKAMKIFGEFSFWFGLIFGILVFFGLATSANDLGAFIFTWIIIGPLPFAFGYWARKKDKETLAAFSNSEIESKVLKLAVSRNGILTTTEVSAILGLSIAESRKALDSFAIKGIAVPEAGDEGGVYYKFIELIAKG